MVGKIDVVAACDIDDVAACDIDDVVACDINDVVACDIDDVAACDVDDVAACDVDVKEASVSSVIIVNIYDVIGDAIVVTVVGIYNNGLITHLTSL